MALLQPSDDSQVQWLTADRHFVGRNTLQLGMDQPAIVQRIQRLQRLESVKYTLEKVVTGERQSRFLPQSLAGLGVDCDGDAPRASSPLQAGILDHLGVNAGNPARGDALAREKSKPQDPALAGRTQ